MLCYAEKESRLVALALIVGVLKLIIQLFLLRFTV